MTPAVFGRPLPYPEAVAVAGAFRALADPTRLQILALLVDRREMYLAQLCAAFGGMAQPSMSHHVKVLLKAGMVTRRREGVYLWYRVTPALWELSVSLRPPVKR